MMRRRLAVFLVVLFLISTAQTAQSMQQGKREVHRQVVLVMALVLL